MFVVGCHRSGTSLVAGILAALLPESQLAERSIGSALDNPAGFYESQQLVAANDRLLAALGADWAHPPLLPVQWTQPELWPLLLELRRSFGSLALGRAWVDKDPRLAITAPAYQHILLRRVGMVVVLRDPLEVAQSLWARDGIALAEGLVLWFVYNLQLAQQLQPTDVVLTYAGLLGAEPAEPMLEALATFMAREARIEVGIDQLQQVLAQRLRPDLQRSQVPQEETPAGNKEALLRCCQELYGQVLAASLATRPTAFGAAFGAIPSVMLGELVEQSWQGWPPQHQPQELGAMQQQLDHALAQVMAMQTSSCWRVTAPLRWFGDVVWRRDSGA